MCNIVEEDFFFSFFFSFLFVLFSYCQTKQVRLLIVLIGYIFSFSFLCLLKKGRTNQVTVTYRRLEKKKSTYLRKRRGNIYHSHHQIDVWLVQLILTLSLAFFLFCSFVYATVVRRFDVCLFFLLLFLSSVVLDAVSFSQLLTNTIITLLDDLVDYFHKKNLNKLLING
jgi:hypothetical protein